MDIVSAMQQQTDSADDGATNEATDHRQALPDPGDTDEWFDAEEPPHGETGRGHGVAGSSALYPTGMDVAADGDDGLFVDAEEGDGTMPDACNPSTDPSAWFLQHCLEQGVKLQTSCMRNCVLVPTTEEQLGLVVEKNHDGIMPDRNTATHPEIMALWIEASGGLRANEAMALVYDFGLPSENVLEMQQQQALDLLSQLSSTRANGALLTGTKRGAEEAGLVNNGGSDAGTAGGRDGDDDEGNHGTAA